jgi:hypothetical protein
MGLELDRTAIERVVAAIADELSGDWLLIGGALVALWLEPRRVTEDIDVIAVDGAPQRRLELMELAERHGLPIEAVNSAADFFVQRIDGWLGEVAPLRVGRRGRVLRPSPTLLLLLKLRRLSESDLDDCRAAIARARADGLPLDVDRVERELDALAPPASAELAQRRRALRGALRGA